MDSTVLIVIGVFLAVIILMLVFSNIRIVPQARAFVIERLGVYKTTWNAGLHLKVPFIERVVKSVSLKEQVLDFPPQPVITKDNVTMQIDSVVFCKVFDPKLFCYGVENPMAGLQNLSATTLRSIIGDMELDATLTSREMINAKMQKVLDEATDAWGIKVTRVEIKNIQPPKEIEEVMTKQMRAERERRQTVLEAQAHQEAVVSRAEGDKRAKILAAEAERDAQISLAEGRARSIQLVYQAEADGLEALKNANVSETVLKLKSIEALKNVADGRATKIFMPSDISNLVLPSVLPVRRSGSGMRRRLTTAKSPGRLRRRIRVCPPRPAWKACARRSQPRRSALTLSIRAEASPETAARSNRAGLTVYGTLPLREGFICDKMKRIADRRKREVPDMNLKGRNFLTLKDFTPEEILCFLDRAEELKQQKKAGIAHQNHPGKNIALIFEKTSTRTRCSFEVAAHDLGMHVTYLDPTGSQSGRRNPSRTPRESWGACTTELSTGALDRTSWRSLRRMPASRSGMA